MPRTKKREISNHPPVEEIHKVEVRELQVDDYLGLADSMNQAYRDWTGSVWTREQILRMVEIFPE
ncbi:MAG TPA: hypothetical protein VNZ86_10985, partial [Bacteroidia bacterium]|nr:hypothetical protein [Bacteroidia bacterium]